MNERCDGRRLLRAGALLLALPLGALAQGSLRGRTNRELPLQGTDQTLPAGVEVEVLDEAPPVVSRLLTAPPSALGERLGLAGWRALRDKRRDHLTALYETGVGRYFGDHSPFQSLSPAERREWIAQHKRAGTDPQPPRSSSCIGWALECVAAAYAGAGRDVSPIRAQVAASGKGTDLARALIQDGWTGIYWNPDARTPADGSDEHPFSAARARSAGTYYGLRVEGMVLDFRPAPGSSTRRDGSGLVRLAQVPFWFGLARGGTHTFVGYGSTISELHWAHMPDSPTVIEESPFEDFHWLSGLIVVPPGTWRAPGPERPALLQVRARGQTGWVERSGITVLGPEAITLGAATGPTGTTTSAGAVGALGEIR